jgi:hypothetical protein
MFVVAHPFRWLAFGSGTLKVIVWSDGRVKDRATRSRELPSRDH